MISGLRRGRQRRSRLRTGSVELVCVGHRRPARSLLEKAEFAARLAPHVGLGVAAGDQERGDQRGDAGRGDIGHRHVDPLPQHPRLEQATRLQAGGAHLAVIAPPGVRAGGPGLRHPHPQQHTHAPHAREASGQAPAGHRPPGGHSPRVRPPRAGRRPW